MPLEDSIPFGYRTGESFTNADKNLHSSLEEDVGDTVSLQAQTSPYFQLRERFKCIEHIDKSETQLITSL